MNTVSYYADFISKTDGTDRFSIPATGGSSTLVSQVSTDTLENKTLASPILDDNIVISPNGYITSGSGPSTYKFTGGSAVTDHDIITTGETQTLSNKNLAACSFVDSADNTKRLQLAMNDITPGTTRNLTPPDYDHVLIHNPIYGVAHHGSFTAANDANPIAEDTVLINGTGVMTRDIHANVLTIPNGYTLNTGGFKIFAHKLIFSTATSFIVRNGIDATVRQGATALVAGTCGQSMPGGNGGTRNSAGSAGTNTSGCIGGIGGSGGDGSALGSIPPAFTSISAVAGGTGNAGQNYLVLSDVQVARKCRDLANSVLTGGRGGGGGGGGSSMGNNGGGGGGGGGIIVIFAHTIELASGVDSVKHIQANGGNGANGSDGSGGAINSGGGGGGGSGMIFVGYNKLINFSLSDINVSATGGIGGLAGTGASGGGAVGETAPTSAVFLKTLQI